MKHSSLCILWQIYCIIIIALMIKNLFLTTLSFNYQFHSFIRYNVWREVMDISKSLSSENKSKFKLRQIRGFYLQHVNLDWILNHDWILSDWIIFERKSLSSCHVVYILHRIIIVISLWVKYAYSIFISNKVLKACLSSISAFEWVLLVANFISFLWHGLLLEDYVK